MVIGGSGRATLPRAVRSLASLLLFSLLLGGAKRAAEAQERPVRAAVQTDAGALIEEVLDAYGGVDAVRAASVLRQEGILVARTGGGHGSVVRVATCPEALSQLVEYPGRSEIRIIEGGEAWRGESAASLTPVEGPMKGAMALQAARVCLPQVLDAFRASAAIERVDDRYTLLSVEVADGMTLRVFVSPDTRLALRSESLLAVGPRSMVFASDYADYRDVEGVLLPFQEESFASGVHTASIRIESVELNPEGDRALLPIPKGR